MKIPGEPNTWEAVQFHIHAGSDHAIDGEYFGADMHVVHREVGGRRYAVLGYFIEPSSPSDVPVFEELLSRWEATEATTLEQCAITTSNADSNLNEVQSREDDGQRNRSLGANAKSRNLPQTFNVYELLPDSYSIYTYDGSLTTPPCSEVVYWNVVDTPISVSVREFLRLTNLILDYVDPATCESASLSAPSGFTARPLQPVNGRKINRHCSAADDGGSTVGTGIVSGSSSSSSSAGDDASGGATGRWVGSVVAAIVAAATTIVL